MPNLSPDQKATLRAIRGRLRAAPGADTFTDGWVRELVQMIDDLAEYADALYQRRLPCREAEVAQQRYERAEADHARAEAQLDRLTLLAITGPPAELAAYIDELKRLRPVRILHTKGGRG